MSAFIVSRDHIWYLVEAARSRVLRPHDGTFGSPELQRRWAEREVDACQYLGEVLLTENIASVRYRYGDGDELPGPIPTPTAYGRHEPRVGVQIDPVKVLKACDGLEYQSCEHPGWEESEAKQILDDIRGMAWRALPGYSAAPWEITDAGAPALRLASDRR